MRTSLLVTVVTAVAACLPAAPAAADPRGCSGEFTGHTTCAFQLTAADRGIRLRIEPAAGSAFAASRAFCCALADPVTKEIVRGPDGEPMFLHTLYCGSTGGGTCQTSQDTLPYVLHDGSVFCEVRGMMSEAVFGTWTCEPY